MTRSLDLELGPATVGVLVGLAGLLYLVTPVIRPNPFPVAGVAVNTVVLAAGVFTVGLTLGAVVFARRGHRLFAIAHAIFAAAWALLVLGPLLGNGDVLLAGVVVLLAGVGFLLSQQR